MIKKMFILLILLLLLSCSVNDSTSLWVITNKSSITVTNIKLGDTLILSSLSPGSTYNYYFIADINGKLTSFEALSAGYATDYDVNKYTVIRREGDYNLKAGNYYFYSDIFSIDGTYYITLRCEANHRDYGGGDGDDYADGGYYDD